MKLDCLSLWLIVLLTSVAHAELYTGPISSALGGTGRAGLDSAEGSFLNPALVTLIKGYDLNAFFRDGTTEPREHKWAAGLGAADNGQDIMFPGALHYVLLRNSGFSSVPVNGELWHGAIGEKLGEQFAIGLSVFRLTYTGQGVPTTVQWNYSLGGLWMISQDMGVAYVLNNLAKPGSDVPQGLRQDMQQGVGFFASLFEVARLRFDITRNELFNPNRKMVYMAGFESLSTHDMIMRLGYRYDDQQIENYVTAGLCYNGPRLKVDYSFEKNLAGTGGALHGVDIRIPF
jgi:hypothetical protein